MTIYCNIVILLFYFIFFARIKFPISNKTDKGKKRKADEEMEDKEGDKTLFAEPYVAPNRGPYPYNQPKR